MDLADSREQSIRSLEREGLIERDRRQVRLPDLDALIEIAGFDPAYLHLLTAPAIER